MKTWHKTIIGVAAASVVAVVAAKTSTIPTCHYSGTTPQTVIQDPSCTPGVTNPVLTKDTICSPTFRTGPYRNVPQSEKDQVAKEYGLSSLKGYEIDHLISLELGGANDIKNLWPELGFPNPKDQVENTLHKRVCSGQITLQEAQREISTDWRSVK